jgi:hypothetical protein
LDGEWRREVAHPLKSAMFRQSQASKARDAAVQMREKLMNYFNNEGSVTWQEAMI